MAVFGLVFLGDLVTPAMAAAILIATAGVVSMGLKPGTSSDFKATLLGLGAGAMFAAIGGGLSRRDPQPGPSKLCDGRNLHWSPSGSLCRRHCCVSICGCANLRRLSRSCAAWRPSLFAGFLGALASQFWFLAFALATAASVRTLALVEVLFAQGISRFIFKQPTTRRETIGISLIVIGVVLLLWAH